MPGICPNCVQLVQEGDTCPKCKGPLISVGQWNEKKDQFLPPRPEAADRPAAAPRVPPDPAAASASPTSPSPAPSRGPSPVPPQMPNSYQAGYYGAPGGYPPYNAPYPYPNPNYGPPKPRIPFYAIRFLLGGMTSVAVFIAIVIAVMKYGG